MRIFGYAGMILIAASFVSPACAGKFYTKDQLMQMVSQRQHPKQGPTTILTNDAMPMDECLSIAHNIMGSIGRHYPVTVITHTSLTYTVKYWANEGAVSATCGDGKLVVDHSTYR